MDLAAGRKQLVDALSSAPDVTGHLFRPPKPRAGDAWPLLGAMERAEGRAFTVTWRVLVFLPEGATGSAEWVEQHVNELVDALEPVGFVERIEPTTITDSDTERYALQISVRGE
ncbi:hypothetical protein [Micromonospora sp. WMMD980]|uniref:hypothetical protein n=1 Tax=Micromonospora sp. WMMD980 TaxID=3016088 RepID=UPI0024168B32|nr:hypothetical protein [Micromonospora sp. WMMD980]MDG4799050.1 hypothetical protein [Micromonospora sp. WMMD980]